MISYVPLAKKLKEKSMSTKDLAEKIGSDCEVLRQSLNKGGYISTLLVWKICNALECSVGDVLKWKEGKQPKREESNGIGMQNIDWDKLCNLIKESEWSMVKLSLELGHISNFLQKGKGRKAKLQVADIAKLEELLQCDKGAFNA